MGYVPSRPPPPRKPVMPSNVSAETGLPVSLPWNTGLHSLLHTPTPGSLFAMADMVRLAYGGFEPPAYVYGVPVSPTPAVADSIGCRYCGRRRSGAATCEGCGAPS